MFDYVSEILDGKSVRDVLTADLTEKKQVYDKEWEQKVWDASKAVFGAQKELWELMAFAPDEQWKTKVLQDALNDFSNWYHIFLNQKTI